MSVERLNLLESLLPKLPPKDHGFAKDLIKKGRKWGCSPGQLNWVNILIDRANGVVEPKVIAEVGSFVSVYAMFAKAKLKNKWPKLHLRVDNNLPVVLAVAGDKSKHPGVVNVTDGGPFGSNRWYGRVAPDGSWEPGKDFPELNAVNKLLKELSADPEKTVSAYGKMTGYCSFCNRPLSDAKSMEVGYGPVCADKWSLPWGKKNAKPLALAASS